MAQVRAITVFATLPVDRAPPVPAALGAAAATIRDRLRRAGFAVQHLRLATQPLEQLAGGRPLAELAATLERAAQAAGFTHLALGTASADAPPGLLSQVPEALASTRWVFCSAAVDPLAPAPASLQAALKVVQANAALNEGFANLRFALVANMPPLSPFFPAAHHGGAGAPAVAVALEAADVLVEALAAAGPHSDVAATVCDALQRTVTPLERALATAAAESGLDFAGIDLSPSPYPSPQRSLGTAVELASGVPFGEAGTLAAVRAMQSGLDAVTVRRAGYSAMMLIPLEDATLANRAAEGRYGLETLLACAAVGGTGLDVVPLPGDVAMRRLCAITADALAIAASRGRPLQVRLLPVPGLAAGEPTRFSFDYFAPTTVFPA